MKKQFTLTALFCLFFALNTLSSQHFEAAVNVSGNDILFTIKPVGGDIICGWSDIEFFLRNSTGSANPGFSSPAITVNTVDFPGVSIPFNGINTQGSELNFNNYWFGVSFAVTTPKTYTNGQEYTVCTISLASDPGGFGLELVHNENFSPTYLALTDQGGNDRSALAGNKFYGTDAMICACPATTAGLNHVLPLPTALPAELTVFKAEKTGKRQATLHWVTSSERLFSGFEVERKSAAADWHFIGSRPAIGANGGATYRLADADAPDGRVYYRLKMLDQDGTFRYSAIQTLLFDQAAAVAVYPNPASNNIFIELQGDFPEAEAAEITLWDAKGALLLSQKATALPGQIITLAVGDNIVPPGSYLLRIKTENGLTHATHVVVQKND